MFCAQLACLCWHASTIQVSQPGPALAGASFKGTRVRKDLLRAVSKHDYFFAEGTCRISSQLDHSNGSQDRHACSWQSKTEAGQDPENNGFSGHG